RRCLCRYLSDPAPGPAVAVLLAVPLPQHDDAVAAVSQPAVVGFLCHPDLRDFFHPVLVSGIGAGSGVLPGSRGPAWAADRLRRAGTGLSWLRPPMGALSRHIRRARRDHGAVG